VPEVPLVEGAVVATPEVPIATVVVPVVGLVVATGVGELAAVVVVPADEPDAVETAVP